MSTVNGFLVYYFWLTTKLPIRGIVKLSSPKVKLKAEVHLCEKIQSTIIFYLDFLASEALSISFLIQLTELQRKEHEKKQLLDTAIVMAEKVVSGRLSKAGYVEGEANNKAKRQKLSAEIESLAASL